MFVEYVNKFKLPYQQRILGLLSKGMYKGVGGNSQPPNANPKSVPKCTDVQECGDWLIVEVTMVVACVCSEAGEEGESPLCFARDFCLQI